MSDIESKPTAQSTAPAPSTSTPAESPKPAVDDKAEVTAPKAKPAKKQQQKKKRLAARRTGADSDGEDDDAPSSSGANNVAEAVSESSAASKPAPGPTKGKKPTAGKKQATAAGKLAPPVSVFPDTNATTPAAWADMIDDEEGVSFDDFNRGSAGSKRGRGAARGARGGRGGKPVVTPRETNGSSAKSPEPPKEYTEEQQKRYEAKRAARKEKAKAKRAAKRDAKVAASSSTPTAPEDADSSLAASTSALKLDDPKTNGSSPNAASPPSHPVPRATPPVPSGPPSGPGPRNNRPFAPGPNDHKMPPRGGNYWMHDNRNFDGPRGVPDFWRGRGGLRGMPRGGFRGMMRGVPPRGRGRGFAFAPPMRPHAPVAPVAPRAQDTDNKPENDPATQKSVPNAPRGGLNGEGKWGHDGFEALQNEDAFRANRIVRGRGRGRGFMRGMAPLRGVAHKFAHLPTPEASPDRSGTAKLENTTTTQGTAEALLEDSGAVTIKLPGVAAAVEAEDDRPPSQPTEAPEPAKSPFPVFTPSNHSPVPFVGSDSGSMSSGYIPAAVPAPPMGVPPNDYYGMPGAPAFRPSPNGAPGFYPANYRPQSFTPEPAFHPHHQQRGSFSGAPGGAPGFYPGGAGVRPRPASPLNPYGSQMGGFFVPARPMQKVSIRSPTLPNAGADEAVAESPVSDGTHSHGGDFVPRYYQQYDPNTGYPAAAGANGQEMYYPQQGYWPAQGYEGDYGAYGGEVMYHNY